MSKIGNFSKTFQTRMTLGDRATGLRASIVRQVTKRVLSI